MSLGRELAGAARRLLASTRREGLAATCRPSLEVERSEKALHEVLQRWDAMGNPDDLDAAGQRGAYLEALQAFLVTSGGMSLGAFGQDALGSRAAGLRAALSEHLTVCRAEWEDEPRGLG